MTNEQPPEPSGTLSGMCVGFRPMWRFAGATTWTMVRSQLDRTNSHPNGIPYPLSDGGMIEHASLYGEAQAKALAFDIKAKADAVGKEIEIMVEMHEIKYSIEKVKIKTVGL